MRLLVATCLAALLGGPAMLAAQERAASVDAQDGREKSPARAQFLAIAHSAVPSVAGLLLMSRGVESDLYAVPGYGLLAHGVVGGPSMGNHYARDGAAPATDWRSAPREPAWF